MPLQSSRLTYTLSTAADSPHYLRWYTDPATMRYITGGALTPDEGRARFGRVLDINARSRGWGFFSAWTRTDGAFVGLVKLVPMPDGLAEVGYGLLPPYWGLGYASEMLACFTDYACELPDIHTLVALTDPDNEASIHVLVKQGFAAFDFMPQEPPGQPSLYFRKYLTGKQPAATDAAARPAG
ncbi:MAG: hypothetical protein OHK0039_10940 [Bacteroidia bacterium]